MNKNKSTSSQYRCVTSQSVWNINAVDDCVGLLATCAISSCCCRRNVLHAPFAQHLPEQVARRLSAQRRLSHAFKTLIRMFQALLSTLGRQQSARSAQALAMLLLMLSRTATCGFVRLDCHPQSAMHTLCARERITQFLLDLGASTHAHLQPDFRARLPLATST